MASPQKENGFTSIANEILEILAKTPLKGSEFSITMSVIRKTYGFHKTEDKISISQLQEMVGLSRRAVIYNLQNLEAKGILVVSRSRKGDKNEVNLIKFNKNYDTWVVQNSAPQVEKNRSSAKLRSSAKHGQKVVQNTVKYLPSFAPTKETLTKDITKETSETSSLIPEVIKLFEGINPACKRMYGNTTQRRACQDLIDTYGFEELKKIIAFLPKNNSTPYKPKANTPSQLWNKMQEIKDAWVQEKGTIKNKPNFIL